MPDFKKLLARKREKSFKKQEKEFSCLLETRQVNNISSDKNDISK